MKSSSNQSPKADPRVKDILTLIGVSSIVAASVVMPGIGAALSKIEKVRRTKELEEQNKALSMYNPWRLRYLLKRLYAQKVIEVHNDTLTITEKGKRRLLKYRLDDLVLERKRDGFWRYVFYDIANVKDKHRRLFRSVLARLKFLQVQRSVYLTPFVCDDEIEFLRQSFDIGTEVQIVKVAYIENEHAYKAYFGI